MMVLVFCLDRFADMQLIWITSIRCVTLEYICTSAFFGTLYHAAQKNKFDQMTLKEKQGCYRSHQCGYRACMYCTCLPGNAQENMGQVVECRGLPKNPNNADRTAQSQSVLHSVNMYLIIVYFCASKHISHHLNLSNHHCYLSVHQHHYHHQHLSKKHGVYASMVRNG